MKYALSLRGGGIRVYSTAIILAELERATKVPCYRIFDMLAGTSGGAILSVALGLGIPASDIVDLFEAEGENIFKSRRFSFLLHNKLGRSKYLIKNLMSALERNFPPNSVLGDCRVDTIVTGTQYQGRSAKLWRSWQHTNIPAYWVASASSAAPTYFEPAWHNDLAFCDGGLWANNPVAAAAAELRFKHQDEPIMVIDIASPMFKETTVPETLTGILGVASSIIDLILTVGEDGADHIARAIVGANGDIVSIEPPLLDANKDLGDASKRNLRKLRSCAEVNLEEYIKEIRSRLRR